MAYFSSLLLVNDSITFSVIILIVDIPVTMSSCQNSIFYKKKQWKPPIKKKKRGKKTQIPGKRKACHSIGTAFLQSIAKIGT
jgi:hypothetical protein